MSRATCGHIIHRILKININEGGFFPGGERDSGVGDGGWEGGCTGSHLVKSVLKFSKMFTTE